MNDQQILPGELASLDAFRGLKIAGMILVYTPGSWSPFNASVSPAEPCDWTHLTVWWRSEWSARLSDVEGLGPGEGVRRASAVLKAA